jgi:hypothetical protein
VLSASHTPWNLLAHPTPLLLFPLSIPTALPAGWDFTGSPLDDPSSLPGFSLHFPPPLQYKRQTIIVILLEVLPWLPVALQMESAL